MKTMSQVRSPKRFASRRRPAGRNPALVEARMARPLKLYTFNGAQRAALVDSEVDVRLASACLLAPLLLALHCDGSRAGARIVVKLSSEVSSKRCAGGHDEGTTEGHAAKTRGNGPFHA